mmetsp:Transcript_39641/g.40407  ORF Transcript_39641/g.40407 Transcript_39641/m.40407 type:complete len:135 (+) Transcript_39641:65-469(+)|eukprot:CAMPEP_0182428224 /NCGR_PEP_ID=MMETSP1167-20130531/21637_1 /TAXON_ID=2988 /ORGANISM="Mallomonas Sp, Strain CCMP3275" /LENGTH=134 /DNA_ID=CAMNT_0024610977 /DNA_START=59 /DNA_END=463 /DNA_ORIENTATION=+
MASIRRIISRRSLMQTGLSMIKGGGGGHHAPALPPFARLAPPSGTIPNEVELVWDDHVAPETCIDFDAPNVSGKQAWGSLLAVFAGLAGLFALISISDPAGNCPVAPRSTVIPFDGLKYELTGEGGDAEEEEEE